MKARRQNGKANWRFSLGIIRHIDSLITIHIASNGICTFNYQLTIHTRLSARVNIKHKTHSPAQRCHIPELIDVKSDARRHRPPTGNLKIVKNPTSYTYWKFKLVIINESFNKLKIRMEFNLPRVWCYFWVRKNPWNFNSSLDTLALSICSVQLSVFSRV